MNKKIIKISLSILGVLILGAGLFITADYFGIFGVETQVKLDFSEVRFKTIDEGTGGLVLNAGVRCFQKGNNNACTRKESHRAGVLSVNIPVRRVIEKTLLFKKSEEIIKPADPKIHVMIIHHNYHNPTETLLLEDVYAKKVHERTVMMPRFYWGDEETEEE